jgi:hypothetical protein
MFGKGNWAIIGIEAGSLEKFQESLKDKGLLFQVSQSAASLVNKFGKKDTYGINPFAEPRHDEEYLPKLDLNTSVVITYLSATEKDRKKLQSSFLSSINEFDVTGDDFKLKEEMPWYGMWVVENLYEDVSDLASKKEHHAYKELSRPFKFLNKQDKKNIEELATQEATTVARKQFPILLDFNGNRIYMQTTSQDMVITVCELLKVLGVSTHGLAWKFTKFDWPQRLLAYLYKNTKFSKEFKERATELARFSKKEIEPNPDKSKEKVLQTYFSMTELESGLWMGLSTRAGVTLTGENTTPLTVQEPAHVTILFNDTVSDFSPETRALLHSANITIQELTTKVNKKGDERQIRNDLFTLDVNSNMNLMDVGAALLRGFDLPGYKREIIRQIKKSKQELSISEYWADWLRQMVSSIFTFESELRTIFGLKKEEAGLMEVELETESEEVET